MGVHLIWLISVVALMDNILANPFLESGLAARTLFQQNMKCNTRSAFKRITMSNAFIYDSNVRNCDYTIRAYNTKVCQVRIDFIYLDLDQPETTATRLYAYCTKDHLRIDGMKFDICGKLYNQHIYVPFDVKRLTDEMVIDFQISSSSFVMWNMEINQIECNHKAAIVTSDERQAPDGCLQYFYEPQGRVDSFNFGFQYYGDTRYAICFNRNYNDFAMLEYDLDNPRIVQHFSKCFDLDCLRYHFDSDCLDQLPGNAKDYIAIPFADVPNEDPHSLFCDQSLHGTGLTCEFTRFGFSFPTSDF